MPTIAERLGLGTAMVQHFSSLWVRTHLVRWVVGLPKASARDWSRDQPACRNRM